MLDSSLEFENDWRDEFKNSFRSTHKLHQFLGFEIPKTDYPLFIPVRLALKIKELGQQSSLWKQFVPSTLENEDKGLVDPIGDLVHSKPGQLIHRYQNRALFMPTNICPVLCRYCFRKNELFNEKELFEANLVETQKYLLEHSEINEIIFSGGDPFILSDEKLASYIDFFASIKSIKHLRFHTRIPVILPSRINQPLLEVLKKSSGHFETISIAIHSNHVDEWDQEIETAIMKLNRLGLQLLSQTVLLKDVNNTAQDIVNLMNKLVKNKIRPYYLHHPDSVKGGMHFMVPLEEGRKIYSELRDQLPGWAIPQYIIDRPDGRGKLPAFNPESFNFSGQFI
ncbi:MAG: lysine 2,3-aminomutase [Bdellovibrio sp. CG12_big_fil_rev_8_21_14_0_65_39_13]|nr:MAG: lysine 2,3-aminomutase [Bdellovibrio sp. CG22_combo_CG10-13_8_21_14_all_39_27]PIQ58993.1 MAG: lysine 2,3-aminomutase [Bdellovibrio sp. CG12_big_fil_rev_8_21_14_0_65_39_13]PIR33960.1 MAG: lysine 2,3-aminomutase [Bdellovibrio sp. CG11_big_fil_rev_8_21_14_0_20_39_38]